MNEVSSHSRSEEGIDWRVVLRAWAVTRGIILVAAIVVSSLFGPPHLNVDSAVPEWISVLGAFDTSWYLEIATRGYDHYVDLTGVVFTNLPFFPLLPLVMKLGIALHLNPFLFALVVNHVAFLGVLAGLYHLTVRRFGAERARTVVWCAAAFPASVYASMAYTEALALFCAVGAAILALRSAWWRAAGLAAVATLARPPGILVSFLVAVIAWKKADTRREQLTRVAIAFVPAIIALAAFLAWMQLTRGAWNLPFVAQEAWRRGQVGISLLTGLPFEIGSTFRAYGRIIADGLFGGDINPRDLRRAWAPVLRDGAPTVLYFFLLRRLWRQEGTWKSPWVLYCAAALLLPLSSGSFTSMTRFGLMAFPLLWAAASWIDEGGSRRRRRWLVVGLVGCVILVVELLFDAP